MTYNQRQIFDDVSFKCSKAITKAYSTSFSSGIAMLNNKFRNPIYGIYGFVRFADEIVDTLHEFNKAELLANFRLETEKAIQDKISMNPVLHSFQSTYHAFGFDWELVDRFLISMEMDLNRSVYDRNGYENYILGSAEVVGLMCLKVFTEGNKEHYEDLKPNAMSLGAAFQKINFLRDIQSDYNSLGRAYFPDLDLTRFSKEDKLKIEDEIEKDFIHAYEGIKKLASDARLGVLIAYVYYRQLFSKIKSLSCHRILEERVSVPNQKKFMLLVSCYVKNNLNLI